MSDVLKIFSQVLSVPILLGIIGVLTAGWVVRQFRGYRSNAPVFRDPLFVAALFLIFAAEAGYHYRDYMRQGSPEVRFERSEFGVYVLRLENDPSGQATKVLAAAIEAELHDLDPDRYRVYTSNREAPEQEADVSTLLVESGASVILHGTAAGGEKCKIRIFTSSRESWHALRPWFQTEEPKQLAELIANQVPMVALEGNTRQSKTSEAFDVGLQEVTTRLERALIRIDQLEQQLIEVRERSGLGSVARRQDSGAAHAVVVGINEYRNPIFDLAYSTADANEMNALLQQAGYRTQVLLDGAATKSAIQEAIVDKLGGSTKPEDSVVIYYAGHGVSLEGNGNEKIGLLCPHDFDESKIYATCISMSQVRDWFALIPAKRVTLIIDACVAGLAANFATRGISFSNEPARATPPDPVVFPASTDGSRSIITAGSGDQLAVELTELGQGLFTFHVVVGLRGAADFDRDRQVTTLELFRYVSEKVTSQSGGLQTPMLFSWGEPISLIGFDAGNFRPAEVEPPLR